LPLLLLLVSVPEKWAPLLFAKKEIWASERISLRKKSSMSVDLQRWQACQDIEQPLATTEPAHGLVKIQEFDLRRLIRRAF
jgi:hypothetical protein